MVQTFRVIASCILIGLACLAGAGAQETNPVKLVKGVISDTATGKPVDGGMIFAFIGTEQEPSGRSRINPKTGAYQMILNPATRYRLRIEAPSYYSTDIVYMSPAGNAYEETEKHFSVRALPIGTTLFSGKVFARNSAQLSPNSDFQKAVELIQAHRYVTLTVRVAPDTRGKASSKKRKKAGTDAPTSTEGEDPGQALTAQRVEALKEYLTARGIDTDRITWKTVNNITASASSKKRSKTSGADISIELTGVDKNISR